MESNKAAPREGNHHFAVNGDLLRLALTYQRNESGEVVKHFEKGNLGKRSLHASEVSLLHSMLRGISPSKLQRELLDPIPRLVWIHEIPADTFLTLDSHVVETFLRESSASDTWLTRTSAGIHLALVHHLETLFPDYRVIADSGESPHVKLVRYPSKPSSVENAAMGAGIILENPLRPESTPKAITALEPLEFLVDPGTATSEELSELYAEISKLYQMLGGRRLKFTLTETREVQPEGYAI